MQQINTNNSYNFVNNYFKEKNTCFSRLFSNETNKNIKRIIDIIYKNIDLEDNDKEILLIRYINIIKKIENKYKKNENYYTMSTLFTGIASILVTGFISINTLNSLNNNINELSNSLWWVSWSLSLSISLINMISSFYKWDRKYLLMFKIFYKLEQEIWMYIESVGPYRKKKNLEDNKKIHKININLFYYRIESIYKKVNNNLIDIHDNEQDENANKKTNNTKIIDIQTDNNTNFIKTDKKEDESLLSDGKKENINLDNIIEINDINEQEKKDT
jgi:hypothetical protein